MPTTTVSTPRSRSVRVIRWSMRAAKESSTSTWPTSSSTPRQRPLPAWSASWRCSSSQSSSESSVCTDARPPVPDRGEELAVQLPRPLVLHLAHDGQHQQALAELQDGSRELPDGLLLAADGPLALVHVGVDGQADVQEDQLHQGHVDAERPPRLVGEGAEEPGADLAQVQVVRAQVELDVEPDPLVDRADLEPLPGVGAVVGALCQSHEVAGLPALDPLQRLLVREEAPRL